MRRVILLTAVVWMIVFISGCATSEQMGGGQVDIKKLLSEMTIEEKVGQMTQITLEVVSKRIIIIGRGSAGKVGVKTLSMRISHYLLDHHRHPGFPQ